MNNIMLYAFPGSCSKVSFILLEHAGGQYNVQLVRLIKGEHKQPAYRKISPKTKVPVLVVDGHTLTENPAIITYLNSAFPKAKLLPAANNQFEQLRQLSDLCFCSATLHPIVTRICKPEFFTQADAIDSVKHIASEAMNESFQLIERQLSIGEWWYGAAWSAMDAYIHWVFGRVEGCGFDVSGYPKFVQHANNMKERPAVQGAMARESAMLELLAHE